MYKTMAEAAAYCRYSRRHFPRLVAEYNIPTYGPKGNRFREADLDVWMENPEAFKVHRVRLVRHRQGAFTPV